MASTYSTSLRLELMATGDQSGTWGTTTNVNLGTLLEQAITGVLSVAEGDTTLTLTTVNGGTDQARNAVVNLTGAMTAGRNVVVPTANKLYLAKNSTTGGFAATFKTAAGTGIAVPAGTARWVYCDGTNVVDGLGQTWSTTSTAFRPDTDDGLALGTTALEWSDLFLASGGVINWNNGNVTLTHSANALALAGGALNLAKGADIASATTTNIGAATGNYVFVTGTTTITAFDTVAAGIQRTVKFAGALTLTNNANIILMGSNITTAAGDVAVFNSEGSGIWRLVSYKYAAAHQGGVFKITVLTSGSAATFTYDAQSRAARIRMVGGGGGSGGVDVNSTAGARGASGGASGGYVEHFINPLTVASGTYTIGAGGLAGSTAGTDGGTGGNTTYSDGVASLTAGGGVGSTGYTAGGSGLSVGVDAPDGGAASGGNVLNLPGNPSEVGWSSGTGLAANVANALGTHGGNSMLGPGGRGTRQATASGTGATTAGIAPAGGYGGGAGGASQILINGTGAAGAAGAGGAIIIEEMY